MSSDQKESPSRSGKQGKEQQTPQNDKAEARQMWHKAAGVGAVGIEMGFVVAIGLFGGNYLDRWLDTKPIFVLVGAAVGVLAAGKALWRTAKQMRKDEM